MTQNNQTPHKRFSIRFTIVSLFIFVTSVVAFATIGVSYYFDIKIARESAEQQFVDIAELSSLKVESLEQTGILIVQALKEDDVVTSSLEQPSDIDFIEHFTKLMRKNDNIFSLFAGHKNGSYFELSNLDAAPNLRKSWGAKAEDSWVAIHIFNDGNRRIEKREFLNNQLAVRATSIVDSDYFANMRPWFINSKASAVTQTPPYTLNLVKRRGISYTATTANDTVVGAIILLSSLDNTTINQLFPSTSRSIIFNSSGLVIADSELEVENETFPYPQLLALANQKDQQEKLVQLKLGGFDHYAYVQKIKASASGQANQYISLIVQKAEVLAPFQDQMQLSILVSIIVVLLFLPLTAYSAKLIVDPIRKLTDENNKISQRKYDQVKPINSRIQEVFQLSQSLVNMSESICGYQKAQAELLDSFVKIIAQATDDKSPYTGGHCERVPKIAFLLAEAACSEKSGTFSKFEFTNEDEWREFRIAAWLHDCGKITTPDHIVDKGTKLEAIYNRIHEVRMRFEVLLRDAEIRYLNACNISPESKEKLRQNLEEEQAKIRDDFSFVATSNIGGEFMSDENIERLNKIACQTWKRHLDDTLGLSPIEEQKIKRDPGKTKTNTPTTEYLLADKKIHITYRKNAKKRFEGLGFTMQPTETEQNLGEIYNLSIGRGTLTDEDRYIIQEHISSTIKMLETLPFPNDLKRVPEYAGGHHEKINGKGYPRSLSGDQLSIPARILAVADIFEALTAADRPYKKAKTLSESLKIMRFMALDDHIDKELFKLFVQRNVYLDYAQASLAPNQIDVVDADAILDGL